ncbi:MAG: YggS family pyridoxal phosphate-dependent enzyme [Chitinophagaceae bacterium]|nr:YggS family pyridoxal phosphate-dependent enzyme [Chitinophagaceae bacterium]
MAVNTEAYKKIKAELDSRGVTLVAVSKTKPASDIQQLYNLGHRDFGENYVQELVEKESLLPKDIRWHFIGHLQSNKVKYIAPFVHLIHGVDSLKLLKEINKQALKNNLVINCLLQVHIAQEETKFGMDKNDLIEIEKSNQTTTEMKYIKLQGLMGMASFSDDMQKVRNEFKSLKHLFDKYFLLLTPGSPLATLSMGMSSDYKIAIEEGSTMVRIGSLLFGERNYTTS